MKKIFERKLNVRVATLGMLAAMAAFCLSFTSCSSDDDGGGVPEGKPTTMRINIPVVKTYATDPGITAESVFNTFDVWVYNSAGTSLEKYLHLTQSDFTNSGSTWTMNSAIEVLSGTKKIYVGLNLPANMVTSVNGGAQTVYTDASLRNNITTGATGFAMFSDNSVANSNIPGTPIANTYEVLPGITTPTTADNEFMVNVRRLASKITAEKGTTLTGATNDNKASGAVFDVTTAGRFQYAMGNVNTKVYPLQKVLATGEIEDPNYTSPASPWPGTDPSYVADFVNDFGTVSTSGTSPWITYTYTGAANYVDVHANGAAATATTNLKYAVENTSPSPYWPKLLTYMSVRVKFVPNQVITAYAAATNTFTTAAGTALPTGNPSLYVYVTSAGQYLYFTTQAAADAWSTDPDGPDNNGAQAMGLYKDNWCYYLVYLDPKSDYQISGANVPYASVRNFYYQATITKINSLGYPGPDGQPDDKKPLATKTNITVDVQIMPWQLIATDVELGQL